MSYVPLLCATLAFSNKIWEFSNVLSLTGSWTVFLFNAFCPTIYLTLNHAAGDSPNTLNRYHSKWSEKTYKYIPQKTSFYYLLLNILSTKKKNHPVFFVAFVYGLQG